MIRTTVSPPFVQDKKNGGVFVVSEEVDNETRINMENNNNDIANGNGQPKNEAIPYSKGVQDSETTMYTKQINVLRRSVARRKMASLEFREEQLRRFLAFLEDYTDEFARAMKIDVGKSPFEAKLYDVDIVKNETLNMLHNFRKWLKPETVSRTLATIMDSIYTVHEPYGLVLIMGAWNYPLFVTLAPFVGCLASGNAIVIKPSDLSPYTGKVMEKMIGQYLDPECFMIVQGGPQETTELLKERFDLICYTGSPGIGKIIHQAAAKYLTPTLLELGGKNPVFIDVNVNLLQSVKRIMWGKLTNAGQTCIAPDYILCPNSIYDEFIQTAIAVINEFYGDDIAENPDYGRIVNTRHVKRIAKLLDGANIVFGGQIIEEDRYIQPTVLADVHPSDAVMQEEIFGPILPVLRIPDDDYLTDSIQFVNEREKPLALYIFTSSTSFRNRITTETSSGAIVVNDVMFHVTVETIPFGGVGQSGMGAYHGEHSLKVFSHIKPVLVRNFNPVIEFLGKRRFPPLSDFNLWVLQQVLKPRSNPFGWLFKSFPYLLCVAVGGGLAVLTQYGVQQLMPHENHGMTADTKA